MADKDEKEPKMSYKETLNLPKTDFPIRANAQENDPKLIKRWEKEDLFHASYEAHKEGKKFILHDGPPYANGNIHLGHAYNKILKDITTKYHRMCGEHVPVTPGWDCHGLPIELRVVKEQPNLSPQELKKACRESAMKWVNIQREEFKRLGVLMDWDNPYLTMHPSYEASIIEAFSKFVEQGYIERKNKTIAWCPSCQTVLASAEIEYKNRKDPSIYVLFPLSQETVRKLVPSLEDKNLHLCVWTTTPWTLPLNRAVLAHPEEMYQVRKYDETYFVVGGEVAKKIEALLETETQLIAEFSAKKLAGLRVNHPFIKDLSVPILLDNSVERSEGTGFVHCAPGAGPLDYEIGVKNDIEIFAPVGPDGIYQKGIQPEELEGVSVHDGQGWVIKKLDELNRLLLKKSISHSFPHCWRCRKGLIFRATRQWFINLSHDELQKKALVAVKNALQFVPGQGRNFLHATIEHRWEWCISRQRIWGVPIPALICSHCEQEYLSKEMIEKVIDGVGREGVEYWDNVSIDELLPANMVCSRCKSREFVKEKDILDVWFDAGVSHYAVLYKNKEQKLFPADLYLEGVDQHRGWFQSSLLTSLVLEGEPAMKTIMTHGFTVDSRGQKMSKSLGNVVAPQDIIDRYGTDVLRLWVASIDIEGDAIVSEALLANVAEVFRKVRNTLRFLLSNLYDFNPEQDGLSIDELMPIDQYALERLYELQETMLYYYDKKQFTGVFHEFGEYTSAELSSFYLDIIKDRLYVEQRDGYARRSAQTACWYILNTFMRLIAPILSFTAEQVSDYAQDKKVSIHLQEFASLKEIERWLFQVSPEVPIGFGRVGQETGARLKALGAIGSRNPLWITLKNVRSTVLKAIEKLREHNEIKHSLEARVTVYFDLEQPALKPLKQFFEDINDRNSTLEKFLKEFFIVSQVSLHKEKAGLAPTNLKGLFVVVEHAKGEKCPRCWHWDETSHQDNLCRRCQEVIKNLG